jgi:sigma-B regulation protein RsbU (phosphoserine phosphatase)
MQLFRGRRRRVLEKARRARSFSRRSADRLKLVLDVSRLLAVPSLHTLLEQISDAAARVLEAERAVVALLPVSAPAQGLSAGSAVEKPDMLVAPLRDLDTQSIGEVRVFRKKKGSFTLEDQLLLEVFAEHAALAVQRYRLLQEAAQGSELRQEMELARRVQEALLPRQLPRVPGLRAAAWMSGASVTGGDTYDLWRLADGRLAVFLADASGHGLPAALMVSQVRSMLRALSEIDGDPGWLLSRVNSRLMSDLEEGRFVTGFLGCLSSDGVLQWFSAGQGPIFIRIDRNSGWELHQAPAVPLGVADFGADGVIELRLAAGGALVAMTDGVFEASAPGGEMFGPARALSVLDAAGDGGAEVLTAAVRDAVVAWSGRELPADDQTIVAVDYEG